MLDFVIIAIGITTAVGLIFVGLFMNFGRAWNGNLGGGRVKQRR